MHTITLERIGEALDHLTCHLIARSRQQSHPDAIAADDMTVTIARDAGTPDHEVALEVGNRLGWPVYDHELLETLATRTGWPLRALEDTDERHASWVQSSFESFFGFPGVREEAFVHRLVQLVTELGRQGKCVVVGRGAGCILPSETTLRVRLVAPRADRIAHLARAQGLSMAEATREVDQRDRCRRDFVRSHFFHDGTDPQLYALVLNTSQLTAAGCADIIVDALHGCRGFHAPRAATYFQDA